MFVKRKVVTGPVGKVEVFVGNVKYSASLRSRKAGKWKKRFKLVEGRNEIRVRIFGPSGSAMHFKKAVYFRPVN